MAERSTILLLFIVALAINVLSVISWDAFYVANDGIQYLSTAKNWLAGNGFSTDVLMYTPHFQGTLPAAQTVWPPGYPLAIAAFSQLGFGIDSAALALNIFTHALAGFLMWRILLKMGLEPFFATICAFAFYFMAMPWAYISALMTEPLVTTLILCALLFLPDPKHNSLKAWILCGLIIALCIYVRYSGVFLAAGTAAGIFLYLLLFERLSITDMIKPCLKLTVLLSMPVLMFLYLMFRTNRLIGTLDRYSGEKIPETALGTFMRWAVEASELLGFTSRSPLADKIALLFFALLLVLIAIIIVWFLLGSINSSDNFLSPEAIRYFRIASLAAVLHSLALVGYLSISSMSSSPLEILSRYIYQFYPGLYAAFCFMLYVVIKRHSVGLRSRLITGMTMTLVAIYAICQINGSNITRDHYFEQSKTASKMMRLPVTATTDLEDFVRSCVARSPDTKSIWSTHGQSIHLHTGVPTLTHSDIYTKREFNPGQLADRVKTYDIGMFVFVHRTNASDDKHARYMKAVKQWILQAGFIQVSLADNQFSETYTADIYVTPECSV